MAVDLTTQTPIVPPQDVRATSRAPGRTTDARATDRDKRDINRDERRAEFRAALSEATGGAIDDAFAQPLTAEARVSVQEARPEKRPSDERELSGDATADILAASRNVPRPTTTAAQSRPFLAMTQHYARSYFSVGGTFATRGESLELST